VLKLTVIVGEEFMADYSDEQLIACVDLEATCDSEDWPLECMEIIEIGAVLCGLDGAEISRFQTFVKPVHNPVLTDFCVELTGIQQCQVDSAPELPGALVLLSQWSFMCGPSLWISWGQFDEDLIRIECERYNIDYPFLCEHRNAKKLFAKSQRFKKRVGLRTAVEKITKIGWQGRHHSGIDDARNLARLTPYIFGQISI
jgi:inhibitor of KinA sporulation pathway (predicted exonuclease)